MTQQEEDKLREGFKEKFGNTWEYEEEHTDYWISKIKEREESLVKRIEENLGDEYELSCASDVDITEVPDELWKEIEITKKVIKSTKKFIINLIK